MRRNQSELIYAVFEVLHNQPLKITHIMYKVNINCLILRNILDILVNTGFAEVKITSKPPKGKRLTSAANTRYNEVYRLTEKGVKFYLEVRSSTRAINELIEASEKQRYLFDAQKMKANRIN
jgi:predicted transcriptional regulator